MKSYRSSIRLTVWLLIGVVALIACTSTIVLIKKSDRAVVKTKSYTDIDSVDIGKPIIIGGDQIKDTITNN